MSREILLVFVLSAGMYFWVCTTDATADDHSLKSRHSEWSLSKNIGFGKGDKGNEPTGESAAWILAAANLPALIGLLLKKITRNTSSETLKDRLKGTHQAQKKYLMPLHYLLNPLALTLAIIHFSLSRCQSSSLPEWGLALMAIIAVIGILIKFKITPKSFLKVAYQIHTSPITIGSLVLILLIGHGAMD